MSTRQSTLFPIFLKLEGKPCLVVGGGPIAEGKIAGLLRSGARVTVIAPELTAALATHAETHAVDWKRRNFERADLDGAFLVVAATSKPGSAFLVVSPAAKYSVA
jgi:siroheme synthase-like protein